MKTPTSIPLRCRCGQVQGVLSGVARYGKRVVCYCDDCQIYAHILDRADVLDAHGGSDLMMSTPAQTAITQGAEHIRGLRLSRKGPLRWYADCCNTPLANTGSPKVPAVVMQVAFVDKGALLATPDALLGPPVARIQARFAQNGMPAGGHPKMPLRLLPPLMLHLATATLLRRGQPSPFFDAQGKPKVKAPLVDEAKREALRAQVHRGIRA